MLKDVKVFIGMPSIDGKYHGLAVQTLLFNLIEVPFLAPYFVYRHRISSARNMITKAFLESDATHLLFLDDDNAVQNNTLKKFIELDKDIVTACIMQRGSKDNVCIKKKIELGNKKFTHDFYKVDELPKEPFRVDVCGMGFCLIKRAVLEAVCNIKTSEGSYSDPFIEIANRTLFEGNLYEIMPVGEDLSFCLKATRKGFEIWADPTIKTSHINIPLSNDYTPKNEPARTPVASDTN